MKQVSVPRKRRNPFKTKSMKRLVRLRVQQMSLMERIKAAWSVLTKKL